MFGSKPAAACHRVLDATTGLCLFVSEGMYTEYTHFKTQGKNCQPQGTRMDVPETPAPDSLNQLATSKAVSIVISIHQKGVVNT
jgi:hypothetical protein